MNKFLVIWRRELAACFLSPIAYVTMVVFLSAAGGTFVTQVIRGEGGTDRPEEMLFAAVLFWFTVLAAVVSMRLFSEERRSGTLETLMTVSVTEAQVVLGKFAGALTFLVIVVTPAVVSIFLLAALSPGLTRVDVGAIAGGGLILFLVAAFCVSLGLLISLMTRNQIISGICSLVAVWMTLLLGWLVSALPFGSGAVPEAISTITHVEEFARGSLDTRPIVLYVSGAAFVLFTAVRVLESRRWR